MKRLVPPVKMQMPPMMHYQRYEPFPQQFEYRTLIPHGHRQSPLQDRLTDLKDLVESEDGQSVSQDIRDLIFRLLFEIESWLNRGEGAMTFEAQITLSNMAYNRSINNINNESSREV